MGRCVDRREGGSGRMGIECREERRQQGREKGWEERRGRGREGVTGMGGVGVWGGRYGA